MCGGGVRMTVDGRRRWSERRARATCQRQTCRDGEERKAASLGGQKIDVTQHLRGVTANVSAIDKRRLVGDHFSSSHQVPGRAVKKKKIGEPERR